MNTHLKQARKEYPKDSYFFTATGRINTPIKVTELKVAEHLDRQQEINRLSTEIQKIWLEISPKSAKINKNHSRYEEFKQRTVEMRVKRIKLKETPSDIIEVEGGVIYCGETDTWAKKLEL